MEKNVTGCQSALEAPILCINNCGFFGTPATMSMCSKCHKAMILKQEQAKLAASLIESIVNGNNINGFAIASKSLMEPPVSAGSEAAVLSQSSSAPTVQAKSNERPKDGQGEGQGPSRCTACRKRVGLTGFSCRCGNVFCSVHRYSDKHDCEFDYHATAKDAISKANPVVKAEKLDKI